jgi:general secretion pathway protein G
MILRQDTPRRAAREAELTLVRAGFTLMEMLVVVAIIVALAGMGGYYYFGVLEQTKKKTAESQVRETLNNAVDSYRLAAGHAPQSLEVLLTKEGGGPYLKSRDQLTDPWGRAYQYNANATNPETGEPEPEIFCQAPDGTKLSNLGPRQKTQ